MKQSKIMPTLVLGTICIVVALLLSLINLVTGPIIKAAQDAAANEALLIVLPDGKNFEPITIDDKYPSVITGGYKADGGFVFQANVTGKSSGLIILCGIDSQGKVVGTQVIADQETDSYDVKVFPDVQGTDGAYVGMDIAGFEPYLVSGATLTSKAYGEAVKAALQSFVIANGGEVDIRTPEQILQDNCNSALGTTGVEFTRWFATLTIEGVDAVYEAKDNSGRVFAIGESFIGVNADGKAVTAEADADLTAKAEEANAAISSVTLTEVTERPEGIKSNVLKVYVTDSGSYVFEVKSNGFSVHEYDEYGAGEGLPMNIKISISADGKIIDCLTTSHSESKGYGDKCATEEYYESFRGVSGEDIIVSKEPVTGDTTDPGAISGATWTTQGYQRAVKYAFDAFKLLTGGNGND